MKQAAVIKNALTSSSWHARVVVPMLLSPAWRTTLLPSFSRTVKTHWGLPKKIPVVVSSGEGRGPGPDPVSVEEGAPPFSMERDWPDKKHWDFAKVFDVINQSYVRNIKYMPHPDMFIDPWISPNDSKTRWLYLTAKRFGVEAAEEIIASHPRITRFRKEVLKEKSRHEPICEHSNILNAIASDNAVVAKDLAQDVIDNGGELPDSVLHPLIELIASTEPLSIETVTLRKHNPFNWPTYNVVMGLFPGQAEIPEKYLEALFFGYLRLFVFENSVRRNHFFEPLISKILGRNELASCTFYKCLFEYKDSLFEVFDVPKIAQKVYQKFMENNFQPPKELIGHLSMFAEGDKLLKLFMLHFKLNGHAGLGVDLHSRVCKFLLTKSDLEAVGFFIFSINVMRFDSIVDSNPVDVHKFFNDGLEMLKMHNHVETVQFLFKKMRELDVVFIVGNSSFELMMLDAFVYLSKVTNGTRVLGLIRICKFLPIKSLESLEVIFDYFLSTRNIPLIICAIKVTIERKISATNQNHIYEFILKVINRTLMKNTITPFVAAKVSGLNTQVSSLLQEPCEYTAINELACCVSKGNIDQIKHLIANNLQNISDEAWRAIMLISVRRDNEFVLSILRVVGCYVPLAYLNEVFEYAIIVTGESLERRDSIWKEHMRTYKIMLQF